MNDRNPLRNRISHLLPLTFFVVTIPSCALRPIEPPDDMTVEQAVRIIEEYEQELLDEFISREGVSYGLGPGKLSPGGTRISVAKTKVTVPEHLRNKRMRVRPGSFDHFRQVWPSDVNHPAYAPVPLYFDVVDISFEDLPEPVLHYSWTNALISPMTLLFVGPTQFEIRCGSGRAFEAQKAGHFKKSLLLSLFPIWLTGAGCWFTSREEEFFEAVAFLRDRARSAGQ